MTMPIPTTAAMLSRNRDDVMSDTGDLLAATETPLSARLWRRGPFAASAGRPRDAPSTIKGLVETSRLDELRWPDFSDYRKHMVNFSQPLNWELSWTRGGRVTPQARTVITLFEKADAKGINAVDYDGSRWDARLRAIERRGVSDAQLAPFDRAGSLLLLPR